jgi:membrane protease YdiL (CAAX protease family)
MTVNSAAEVQQRVVAGTITWAGPLIMLVARSVLAVICQALVSAIFYAGSADAWNEAGEWWFVYGTVIDAGCIVLLVWLTRREGIRLFDLGSYSRERWLRDVLIGLGFFVPVFLLAAYLPVAAIGGLVYVGTPPLAGANLPMVGYLYGLIVWPIIWSVTEDTTYGGYSLPRVEALTGRKWQAVVVVTFFVALQHIFLPLRLEWQWLVRSFFGFVPFAVVFSLLYLRWRRLLPMHVIHWASDSLAVISLLMASVGGG